MDSGEAVLGAAFAAIIALIWFCGEMARLVDEDDNRGKTSGKAKRYFGAPMRKKFTGFDLSKDKEQAKEKARKKREKSRANWAKLKTNHVPTLALQSLGEIGPKIDLTPRDSSGTPRLLSARQLQEISRGQYVSQREKDLEQLESSHAGFMSTMSRDEEVELRELQIKSAKQEVLVRDRHLAILKRDVEKARERAAIRREENMKMGLGLSAERSDASIILELSKRSDLAQGTPPQASPALPSDQQPAAGRIH